MLSEDLIPTIESDIRVPGSQAPETYCRYIRWLLEERRMQKEVIENMVENLLAEHAIVERLQTQLDGQK